MVGENAASISVKKRTRGLGWDTKVSAIERDEIARVWPVVFKKGESVLITRPRDVQVRLQGCKGRVVRLQTSSDDPPVRRYELRVFDQKRGWLPRTYQFAAEELDIDTQPVESITPQRLLGGSAVQLVDGSAAWLLEEAGPKSKSLRVALVDRPSKQHDVREVQWTEVASADPWRPHQGDPVEFEDGTKGRVAGYASPNAAVISVSLLAGSGYKPALQFQSKLLHKLPAALDDLPPLLPEVSRAVAAPRRHLDARQSSPRTRWSPWRAFSELMRPFPEPTVPPDRATKAVDTSAAAETTASPMAPGDLAEVFAKTAYSRPFRRYQSLALHAFEKSRGSGRRRSYLVLPPGAGKTVLGLEIARRLGNPTIAFGPNTAVQEQWVSQWTGFEPVVADASDRSDLKAPITALTYQSLCNLESHPTQLEDRALQALHRVRQLPTDVPMDPRDAADLGAVRARLRRSIALSGDRESLFELLSPNGRRLVETIHGSGRQWTVILDECHHLLEMWGHLVLALADELGDKVFLLGLTATPPGEMDQVEADLYGKLFGHADYEVPTPAVVKEGSLAPYRDLCMLTTPLDGELQFIREEGLRLQSFLTDLMDPHLGSISFPAWLRVRFIDRQGPGGSQLPWSQIESTDPALARAALRLVFAGQMEMPAGACLREEHRAALTIDDWVALIDDWCRGHLRRSREPADLEAWERIRHMLPGIGWVLTREGIRPHVSPVDRLLLLSTSKAAAAIDVLQAELNDLGAGLRAILVCDFERASAEYHPELNGVLDPAAGSAALMLQHLLSAPVTKALDPILVTGRSLAMSRAAAGPFLGWLSPRDPALRARLQAHAANGGPDEAVELVGGSGVSTSEYLPQVTAYFEAGHARCLIGTRGLLAEGWDAPSVNVVIDLTGVGTRTTVHQMRGRSLRLDPNSPHKVGHNWDLVCVTDAHPKGVADYQRFVRKHAQYFSITPAGEIESGVSHVDPSLSPHSPPPTDSFATLNASALAAPEVRPQTYELWKVGQPYSNTATETVRIKVNRSAGVPAVSPLAGAGEQQRSRPGLLLGGGAVAGFAALGAGLASGADLVGGAAALVAWGAGAYFSGRSLQRELTLRGSDSILPRIGRALAEGLLEIGKISTAAVTVLPQADGFYRCYLDRGSYDDSRVFAAALDELLAPLDQPRYIIPRFTADVPKNAWKALITGLRLAGGGSPGTLVYHAVPAALADKQEHAAAFGQAWNRHVSPGDPIYQSDARAQAILELQRGESPVDATTQMRVLWR